MKNKKLPIFIGAGVLALLFVIAAVVAILLIVKNNANKINYDDYRFVEVYEFDGEVTLSRDGEDSKVYEGMRFIPDDTCKTGEDSEVELLVDDDKHILAKEDTKFKISANGSAKKGSVSIKLVSGEGIFTIDKKLEEEDSFEVKTGNATMCVRGTKFLVSYDNKNDSTYVEVYEGTVWAESSFGTFVLEEGDNATINEEDYTSTVSPQQMDGETTNETSGPDEEKEVEDFTDITFDVSKSGAMSEYCLEFRDMYIDFGPAYDIYDNVRIDKRSESNVVLYFNDGSDQGYSVQYSSMAGNFSDGNQRDRIFKDGYESTETAEGYKILYTFEEEDNGTRVIIMQEIPNDHYVVIRGFNDIGMNSLDFAKAMVINSNYPIY